MKKILLLSGISTIGLAAFAADVPEPLKLVDAYIQNISPNGKYAVSNLNSDALSLYDLETGEVYRYATKGEYDIEQYRFGLGKCFSDNGIFVGGRTDGSAEYWKNGEWHSLSIAGKESFVNGANAISNDGSRICGILGSGEFSYNSDVLMSVPCIWNAEGDGYGEPVVLPYPERDVLGTVPQYVKAIDISGDGKTIIGEIVASTGMLSYPVIYKEDGEGNWSYEIPHADLLKPEGFVLPENPGEYTGEPPYPQLYMTNEQAEAYGAAMEKYWNGELNEEPDCLDYMSGEDKDHYLAVLAEYEEWEKKLEAWNEALDELSEYYPSYQDNSMRISNDGLTYGCTISKGSIGPWGGGSFTNNVWIFDMNSDKITKYDQQDNLCLSYLANGGVCVASTPTGMSDSSNSFILKDDEVTGMYEWMNSRMPEYASWMKQNMEFEYHSFDDDWNPVLKKEFMTGHAVSTPDLSIMALSVHNIGFPEEDESVWDDPEYKSIIGYGFIFNLNVGSAVEAVRPAAEGKVIYDLYGRQLKEAGAPGIYIINGEKRVVR